MHFTARADEGEMITLQGPAEEILSEEAGHTREDLDRFGWWSMKNAVEAQRKHDHHRSCDASALPE